MATGHGRVRAHGSSRHGVAGHGSFQRRRRDRHVLLMWPRHAEAHRGRHLLPAMASLAGEVGDLVHVGSGVGMQDQACRQTARVDSWKRETKGAERMSDAK